MCIDWQEIVSICLSFLETSFCFLRQNSTSLSKDYLLVKLLLQESFFMGLERLWPYVSMVELITKPQMWMKQYYGCLSVHFLNDYSYLFFPLKGYWILLLPQRLLLSLKYDNKSSNFWRFDKSLINRLDGAIHKEEKSMFRTKLTSLVK